MSRVGAYLPAGRFPLTASAFMTVGVAKVAGVSTVIACTPPQPGGGANDAVVYAAHLSGVDRVFVLGGVQALAAMAFGLLGELPVDMLVGAGNAYVAEAKRQLFGAVAIDLLAGPSEVAVLSDETADPEIVAADLLGQAEHGSNSPAALVTTSEEHGRAVIAAVEHQLEGWRPNRSPARRGVTTGWSRSPTTGRPPPYSWTISRRSTSKSSPQTMTGTTSRLQNYGSVFLGPWSTVAYSDKGMAGTNHVLPTAGGAKHSAGLSVSRYLKPLTYQRISSRGHSGPGARRSDHLRLGGDGRAQRDRHAQARHATPRRLRSPTDPVDRTATDRKVQQ